MSCGTLSEPIETVATPKPLACDPAIVAYSQEEPALRGSIPQAHTDEQATGIESFLLYVRSLIDYGREANRIANLAKNECIDRVSGAGPQANPTR